MKPIWRVTRDGKNFVGTGRIKKPKLRMNIYGDRLGTDYSIKCLGECTSIRKVNGENIHMFKVIDKQTVFQKIEGCDVSAMNYLICIIFVLTLSCVFLAMLAW